MGVTFSVAPMFLAALTLLLQLNASQGGRATFVYIVGVEGVGHHAVAPAIAAIGHACNFNILYENEYLRAYQQQSQVAPYAATISRAAARSASALKNLLVIEDSSFPTGHIARNSSVGNAGKKENILYDLEWIHNSLRKAQNTTTRFLYLNRDFYRTVASHPEFDGNYQTHAKVLHDFVWYINEEYQRIEAKESGLWRQINYEWFTQMDDCPSLVASVADFLGFKTCDIEFACTLLNAAVHTQTHKEINATEVSIARSFNVTLPIPTLDISKLAQHRIAPYVSDRKLLDLSGRTQRLITAFERDRGIPSVPQPALIVTPPPELFTNPLLEASKAQYVLKNHRARPVRGSRNRRAGPKSVPSRPR